MREIIDAAALREMLLCANAALEENKQRINELNVFPVLSVCLLSILIVLL